MGDFFKRIVSDFFKNIVGLSQEHLYVNILWRGDFFENFFFCRRTFSKITLWWHHFRLFQEHCGTFLESASFSFMSKFINSG